MCRHLRFAGVFARARARSRSNVRKVREIEHSRKLESVGSIRFVERDDGGGGADDDDARSRDAVDFYESPRLREVSRNTFPEVEEKEVERGQRFHVPASFRPSRIERAARSSFALSALCLATLSFRTRVRLRYRPCHKSPTFSASSSLFPRTFALSSVFARSP